MRRRRLLQIAGTSLALIGLPALPERRAVAATWKWRGTALGAGASIRLLHEDRSAAEGIISEAVDELHRLEAIFSLYQPGSALSRLNAQGALDDPPPELVQLLELSRRVGEATDGAFDISVQPLWQLYATHFAEPGADADGPPTAQVEAARQLVDYRAIDIGTRRVVLARAGMALTLNGIAQGYIADRITERLRARGIGDTLVDTGEIRALGHRDGRADGQGWQVGIEGTAERVELSDRAIATSAPMATRFDAAGRFNHLLDPRTARSTSSGTRQVSVIASSAALADAASTALAILPQGAAPDLVGRLALDKVLMLDWRGALHAIAGAAA